MLKILLPVSVASVLAAFAMTAQAAPLSFDQATASRDGYAVDGRKRCKRGYSWSRDQNKCVKVRTGGSH